MNRANPFTRALLLLTAGALLASMLLPADAGAIPAFARKYGFSCSTCHAPFPRLKAYGEEFAGNGFQLSEDQEPVRAYRDTGDPLLKLQREVPLALRVDAWLVGGTEGDGFLDLQTPWGFKLLSGGTVAPDVGYYFYFYMSERGEVAGIEDAYIHFNDAFGQPLDLMIGQFQLSDPMMKRELRLTYEDYQIYRVKPGASHATLTYDRGLMITYDTPLGVGLVGQIVNGNGKGEAENGLYDGDRDKGYGLHASYELGLAMVAGYYYRTREVLGGEIEGEGPWSASNEVEAYGPNAAIALGDKLHLVGQYLHREDSDAGPYVDGWRGLVQTDGVVAELTWLPQGEDGRLAGVLLYNWIDSDEPSLNYETVTLHGSYLYARNLRMSAEIGYDVDREKPRFAVGITSGF